jgi:sRNA-binding carbon storage regulator CsrA
MKLLRVYFRKKEMNVILKRKDTDRTIWHDTKILSADGRHQIGRIYDGHVIVKYPYKYEIWEKSFEKEKVKHTQFINEWEGGSMMIGDDIEILPFFTSNKNIMGISFILPIGMRVFKKEVYDKLLKDFKIDSINSLPTSVKH